MDGLGGFPGHLLGGSSALDGICAVSQESGKLGSGIRQLYSLLIKNFCGLLDWKVEVTA